MTERLTYILKEKPKQLTLYGFFVLLILQLMVLVCFSIDKADFHIDEYYTYILSNSSHSDGLANSADINGQWVDGREAFGQFVSVQPGERFAYRQTYLNNTTDAHPPLHYFLLHTVCSFFPDVFSKWFGLSINILFFILTEMLLFKLSCELFRGVIWKLLPVAIYGFSPVALDVALFIRMYMMLTFFTVALYYIHFRMYRGELKYPYVWCFLVVFLGVFTQYFFAIFAFFTAAFYCLYLLRQSRVRDFFLYSGSMTAGVLLVFTVYPDAYLQITGSKTNNVGNAVASGILDFSLFFRHIYSYLWQFAFRTVPDLRWRFIYGLLLCAVIGLSYVLRDKENRASVGTEADASRRNLLRKMINKTRQSTIAVWFTATFIGLLLTFLVTVQVSVQFAYLRYIYNILPIIFLALCGIIYFLGSECKVNRTVLSVGFMGVVLLLGLHTVVIQNCEYLFTERTQATGKTVEFVRDKPLIVVNNGTNHCLTANFMLLSHTKLLYISETDEIDIDALLEDREVPEGIACLVLTDQEWSQGYDGDETVSKIISRSEKFNEYEEFGEETFSKVYWIT